MSNIFALSKMNPDERREYISSLSVIPRFLDLLDTKLNDNDIIIKYRERYGNDECIQFIKFLIAYSDQMEEIVGFIKTEINTYQRKIMFLLKFKGGDDTMLYPIDSSMNFDYIFLMYYSSHVDIIKLYNDTTIPFIKDKIIYYLNDFYKGGGNKNVQYFYRIIEENYNNLNIYLNYFYNQEHTNDTFTKFIYFISIFCNRKKDIAVSSWFLNIINSVKHNKMECNLLYLNKFKEYAHNIVIYEVFNKLFEHSKILQDDKFRKCIINGLHVMMKSDSNSKMFNSDEFYVSLQQFIASPKFKDMQHFKLGCTEMITKYQTNSRCIELVNCIDDYGESNTALRRDVNKDGVCDKPLINFSDYNLDLEKKYLKYKTKYLKLKNVRLISL